MYSFKDLPFELWIDSPGQDASEYYPLTLDGNCPYKHDSMPEEMYVNDISFRFQVMSTEVKWVSQALLLNVPSMEPRLFRDAFPDLAKEIRGREGVNLSILASQVYSEAARADETFDAFGIKFPWSRSRAGE